jgi:hypothetical protein
MYAQILLCIYWVFCELIILYHEAGWSSCNAVELYLGGARFKSVWTLAILAEVLCGFLQFLQSNARIVSPLGHG